MQEQEQITSAPAASTLAIPLRATPTAGASMAVATPPIGPIISLLDATRPLAIHWSGRRHQFPPTRTPSVSHKPIPASEPASAITQPRHVVVVCAGTHSAVRAARRVSRSPPRTAPTVSAMEAGLPKPGTASASSPSSASPSPPSSGRAVAG
jgi:hypothetical protein